MIKVDKDDTMDWRKSALGYLGRLENTIRPGFPVRPTINFPKAHSIF